MHEAKVLPPLFQARPISLFPSKSKASVNRAGVFFKSVVLPLLLTGAGLHLLLELRGAQLLIALALALLVLLNVYFFIRLRQNASGACSLQIDLDEIRLLQGGRVLHREPLKNVRVARLNWGNDAGDSLPVLRIEGTHFPRLFIASAQVGNTWKTVEAAGYQVGSEKEWQRLVQALAGGE